MKLPVMCRTCDARDTDKLYKLATATKRFPDKLLSDILAELTHIDVNISNLQMINIKQNVHSVQVNDPLAQRLPQCLCGTCARKLIGAYYYVKQAVAAHELLMNHVQNNDKTVTSDCLQEVPMELCAEQHVEVCLIGYYLHILN